MQRPVEAGTSARPGAHRPGRVSLTLRPFGYLFMGVLWSVLTLVVVAVPVGVLVYLGDGDGGVSWAQGNPVEVLVVALIVVPVCVGVLGPVLLFQLPTMCWPLAVLSFTYVARSMRPSYAGEKLSFSTWGSRSESLGPPGVGGVAMSSQPVRASSFTNAVMRFYVAGWRLDGRVYAAMLPASAGWTALIVAVMPGFPSWVRIACAVAAVPLVVWSVLLVYRALRAQFAAVDEDAYVDRTAVSSLGADELRTRRERVERRRQARLGRDSG